MNTTDKDTKLTTEEIATCAYHLWESNGRQEGRDAEYWFQAQTNLKARSAKPSSATNAPRPASALSPAANANASSPKPEDASRKRKQNNGSARRQPEFA